MIDYYLFINGIIKNLYEKRNLYSNKSKNVRTCDKYILHNQIKYFRLIKDLHYF